MESHTATVVVARRLPRMQSPLGLWDLVAVDSSDVRMYAADYAARINLS